ncbi:hypothetical protein ACS5PN_03880 [Roseateles sp. NT4]|uniref:hypothetical protein n=1 Tax=Roseateles sp. NT4 TaxID=3453715 RepID=UPI003EEDCD3B
MNARSDDQGACASGLLDVAIELRNLVHVLQVLQLGTSAGLRLQALALGAGTHIPTAAAQVLLQHEAAVEALRDAHEGGF